MSFWGGGSGDFFFIFCLIPDLHNSSSRPSQTLIDLLPRPEKLESETKMKTFITRAPYHPRSSYAHRWNRRRVEMLTDNLPRPEKLESETKMKTFITRAPDHPRSSYAHRWNRRSVEMLTD